MAQNSDSDSIYQTPTSETNVAPEGDEMAAFVGPRFDAFYAAKFAACDGGAVASWHWPAFFITAFWLLYRKMWAYALVYWLVWPISLSIIAELLVMGQSDPYKSLRVANFIYYGSYAFVGFILMPIFANRIYYRHARQKLAKVALKYPSPDQQQVELARIGGTSKVIYVILPIVLVALIGILAAIAIPAYQDYTIRAQVSEGLVLSGGAKTAVSNHYFDAREFPTSNTEAGLVAAERISGSYTASINVDYGVIEVTYGHNAHPLLQGSSLFLTPDVESGSVIWDCYSDSIAPKHLPASCR